MCFGLVLLLFIFDSRVLTCRSCSLWCHNRIQASTARFSGQRLWRWSLWSPHPHQDGSAVWHPHIGGRNNWMDDREVQAEGPAPVRFSREGPLPWWRNWRRSIHTEVPSKLFHHSRLDRHLPLPNSLLVCVVQGICRSKLRLPLLCYLLLHTTTTTGRVTGGCQKGCVEDDVACDWKLYIRQRCFYCWESWRVTFSL